MLELTISTLASHLNKELNLGLKSVAVTQGDYLIGKLTNKHKKVKLPAMSIFKESVKVRRNTNNINATAGVGIPIAVQDAVLMKLKILPLTVAYDLTFLFSDQYMVSKTEMELLWMFEDTVAKSIPLTLQLDDLEFELPAIMGPTTTADASFSTSKQEEWDGGVLHRLDISLEVYTFALKAVRCNLIKKVNYKIEENEIILAEGSVDEDTFED